MIRIVAFILLFALAATLHAGNLCADQQTVASLWAQKSIEKKYLMEIAYKNAQDFLQEMRDSTKKDTSVAFGVYGYQDGQTKSPLPNAVVLDLDETVLNNEAYRGALIRNGQGFDTTSWNRWVREGKPAVYPAALQFLNKAESLGYVVFFVSNRACTSAQCEEKSATLAALLVGGVTVPSANNLLLKGERGDWNSNDKKPRYDSIAKRYNIRMIIGDDAKDHLWSGKEPESVKTKRNHVLLPNPAYGSWEDSLGDCLAYRDSLTQWQPELSPFKNNLSTRQDTLQLILKKDVDKLTLKIRDMHLVEAEVVEAEVVEKTKSPYTWKGLVPVSNYKQLKKVIDSLKLSNDTSVISLRDYMKPLQGDDAHYGHFRVADTILQLSQAGENVQLPIAQNLGVEAANVRIYSNVAGFFGQTKGSVLQIDARIDFSFIPIYPAGLGNSPDYNFILLQKMSPYAYFPSIRDQGGTVGPGQLDDPIYRYHAAITRYGMDFNLAALYLETQKVRINLMVGAISNSMASSDSVGKYSNGVNLKPYVRWVFYGDHALNLDLRAERDYLWTPETARMDFWGVFANLETRRKGSKYAGPFFLKCGVQFKQNDISGTMTPSLEIGYQFTTGIFKKIETLLD
jgi:5'-nucleotidase (lipoprotein e(P4) family)